MKIILGLLLLIFVVVYHTTTIGSFDFLLFDIGCVCLIIALVFFVRFCRHSQLAGYWLKPSNLFIIGYLAVNIQYILDYRLGLKNDSSTLIIYPQTLNYCFIIGGAGLIAFVLGYIWKRNNPSLYTSVDIVSNYKIPSFLMMLHFMLFCLFILTINVSDFLLGSAFVDETTQSPFEGLFYLVTMVLVLFISRQNVHNKSFVDYLKGFPVVSLTLIILYMVLRMFSGDRGPMIYTGLLLMYGYISATKKKWKLSIVVLLLMVSSLFVSLLGMARLGNLNDSFFNRIANSYTAYTSSGRFGDSGERSILSATEELGFSFMVNH